MYEYIIGIFVGMSKEYIILENNDIGYKIYTSGSTIKEMPQIGEKVKLYLQQIVREDFIGLYGFLTKEELELFNLLLTINGVGAKAALSLLSISNVAQLKYAIVYGEEKVITKASGIGKKIAQRIILELKDKISVQEVQYMESVQVEKLASEETYVEALGALLSLGYSEKEAEKALKTVDTSQSLENVIKNCLKYLMH